MVQGWALYAHIIQSDGWLQFGGIKRKSRGYVGQEVDRLVAIAKKTYGWKD